jgi:hypothetical protein
MFEAEGRKTARKPSHSLGVATTQELAISLKSGAVPSPLLAQ